MESLPGVWHKSLSVRCSLPWAKKPVTALLNKAYSHATKIEATVYAAVLDDDADVVPFCSREFVPGPLDRLLFRSVHEGKRALSLQAFSQ